MKKTRILWKKIRMRARNYYWSLLNSIIPRSNMNINASSHVSSPIVPRGPKKMSHCGTSGFGKNNYAVENKMNYNALDKKILNLDSIFSQVPIAQSSSNINTKSARNSKSDLSKSANKTSGPTNPFSLPSLPSLSALQNSFIFKNGSRLLEHYRSVGHIPMCHV
jgi:hypothetical protein